MGRGRGKSKKQTVVTTDNDVGNGNENEEKIPVSKRRGRPQKPLKDEVEDEGTESLANGDEIAKSSVTSNSLNGQISAENGTKRKRSSEVKENSDTVKEEDGLEAKSIVDGSVKSVGFRHIGSRRKSKPRRAAEAGVECK